MTELEQAAAAFKAAAQKYATLQNLAEALEAQVSEIQGRANEARKTVEAARNALVKLATGGAA